MVRRLSQYAVLAFVIATSAPIHRARGLRVRRPRDVAQWPAHHRRARFARSRRHRRDELPRGFARRSRRYAGHGARPGAHDVPGQQRRHRRSTRKHGGRDGRRPQRHHSDHRDAIPLHRTGECARRGVARRSGPHARRQRLASRLGQGARRHRTRGLLRRFEPHLSRASDLARKHVRGHAVRAAGRRHARGVRRADERGTQELLRYVVPAEQRSARDRW